MLIFLIVATYNESCLITDCDTKSNLMCHSIYAVCYCPTP